VTDIVDRLNDKASGAIRFDGVPKWKLEFAAASAEIQRLRLELKSANELLRWSEHARNVTLEEAAMVAHRISASARSFGGEETAEMIEREIRALKDGAKT
jgi:hypothetical protein